MKLKIFQNKIIMITIALMLLQAVLGQTTLDKDSLRVGFVNQEPDPVGPGEYIDIRLQVENLGDDTLEKVVLELLPAFPFSLEPGQSGSVNIGTLGAFQNSDRAFIKKYKLRVSEDAIEGTNTLKARVKSGSYEWANYEFDINIRTSDANLAIESVTTTPKAVEPGKDASIKINIRNLADSVLKDITMNLDLTLASLGATSVSLDALPFATLSSGTEKRIRQLSPGEEAFITYNIRAYPDAESKVYKIPLALTYKDELNTEYTTLNLIGIVVNSEPDVAIVLDDSEVTKEGQKGEVTIRFINKGLTDIKFVNVVLNQGDGFELLSENEVYMGNVDSDDYETAEFEIYVETDAGNMVILPVHYEYMDANNNKYKAEDNIEVRLFSVQEEKKFGNGDQNNTARYWVVAIILIVVLFIGYRIYKRRKK